jgi:hypothetical protein
VQTVEHSELSWACRRVQISESVERNRGCRSARKGACPILDGDETTIINPNDFGIRFPEGTNETPSSLREYENQAQVNPLTLGTSPYAYRRLTIVQSVRLLFLVLYPLVGLPHGVCEIRPLLFPRPPPWG